MCLRCGQAAIDAICEKAEMSGAYAFYCEDLKEEFVTDYVFKCIEVRRAARDDRRPRGRRRRRCQRCDRPTSRRPTRCTRAATCSARRWPGRASPNGRSRSRTARARRSCRTARPARATTRSGSRSATWCAVKTLPLPCVATAGVGLRHCLCLVSPLLSRPPLPEGPAPQLASSPSSAWHGALQPGV